MNYIEEILNNIKEKYKDYYVADIVSGKDLKTMVDEIERLNYIIDKQDRDITALSNGNRKLNNIINELEKKMIFDMNDYKKDLDIETGNIYLEYYRGYCQNGKDYYDKLQELKGDSSMSETVKLEYKVKVLYKEKEYDLQELFDYLIKEIDKQENIKKEVREYIGSNDFLYDRQWEKEEKISNILDKENK